MSTMGVEPPSAAAPAPLTVNRSRYSGGCVCGCEFGAWGNSAAITFILAYTSATRTQTYTHACYVCIYDVCLRAHVHAILTTRRIPLFKPPGVKFPSLGGSQRAVAAARLRPWRMHTLPLHASVPFLGSAAEEKPLRLTQEPADASSLLLDAATAAAGGVRRWEDAKTWAPSIGADLGPRSTACDWTAKFVLKPITNFEVMGAKS